MIFKSNAILKIEIVLINNYVFVQYNVTIIE
jgi:hypothetical protein